MKVHKYGVLLAALAVAVTGCRGGEPEGDGEVDAPGVTSDPCPDAVNEDNGCIYLGTISDLTAGAVRRAGGPDHRPQKAFWDRVNEDGGIGGYDIDTATYVKDNLYNPETHKQVYGEISGEVLALAQTLGSPTTLAILADLKRDEMIGAPASWTSLWAFEDAILESGASYCVEGMNAVDYMVENEGIESVMAVGFAGDYGGDGRRRRRDRGRGERPRLHQRGDRARARRRRPERSARSSREQARPGAARHRPDRDRSDRGRGSRRGLPGPLHRARPTWNPALLESPAAEALQGLYWQSGTVGPLRHRHPGPPGDARRRSATSTPPPTDTRRAGPGRTR